MYHIHRSILFTKRYKFEFETPLNTVYIKYIFEGRIHFFTVHHVLIFGFSLAKGYYKLSVIFTRQTYLSNHHRCLDNTKEEIKTIPGKRNPRILFFMLGEVYFKSRKILLNLIYSTTFRRKSNKWYHMDIFAASSVIIQSTRIF